MLKTFVLFLHIFILFISPVFSETILLNSGKTIEGTITERTSDAIKIDIGVGMPVTYYLEDVAKIGDQAVAPAPVEPIRRSAPPPPQNLPQLINEEIVNSIEQNQGFNTNSSYDQNSKKTMEAQLVDQVSTLKSDLQNNIKSQADQVVTVINNLDDEFPIISSTVQNTGNKLKEWNTAENRAKFIVIFLLSSILCCFPIYLLAKKKFNLRKKNLLLLAWIPVLQLYLLVRLAERSWFTFILLFVPVLNIFIFIGIWMRILAFLQKPLILGLLMVIPGLNILLIWLLPFWKTK